MARRTLIIFAVDDLARSLSFYTSAFGWSQHVDVPVYAELAIDDAVALGLYKRDAFAVNTGILPTAPLPNSITGTELYLWVDDLAGAIEGLEAAGARLLSARAPRPWGDEAAYYADPDGNVVAVAVESE